MTTLPCSRCGRSGQVTGIGGACTLCLMRDLRTAASARELSLCADERRKTLDEVVAHVRAHIEPALTILPPPFNVHLASHYRMLAEEIEAMKNKGGAEEIMKEPDMFTHQQEEDDTRVWLLITPAGMVEAVSKTDHEAKSLLDECGHGYRVIGPFGLASLKRAIQASIDHDPRTDDGTQK